MLKLIQILGFSSLFALWVKYYNPAAVAANIFISVVMGIYLLAISDLDAGNKKPWFQKKSK